MGKKIENQMNDNLFKQNRLPTALHVHVPYGNCQCPPHTHPPKQHGRYCGATRSQAHDRYTTIHHTAYLMQIVGQYFMLRMQQTASDSGGHNAEFAPVDHHGRDKIPVNWKTVLCVGIQN